MKSALKLTPLKLMLQSALLPVDHGDIYGSIVGPVNSATESAARSVNSVMTASYSAIGCRIFEAVQKCKRRAGYGDQSFERLSFNVTRQFCRGFFALNLDRMRQFFLGWVIAHAPSAQLQRLASPSRKVQMVSAQFGASCTTPASRQFNLSGLANAVLNAVLLRCSGYVRSLSDKDGYTRQFYETEALRGGWSLRHLDHQIGSWFYERTSLSKNKAAMLPKGAVAKAEDAIIDLKFSSLKHAEFGQMHTHCNYPNENWALPAENPPVGLILCADKGHALALCALDGLPSKTRDANYIMLLPDAEVLQKELQKPRVLFVSRPRPINQNKS